jgi:hypothetical protein
MASHGCTRQGGSVGLIVPHGDVSDAVLAGIVDEIFLSLLLRES